MKHLVLWVFLLTIFLGCDSKTDLASTEDSSQVGETGNNRTEFSVLAWNVESGGNDPLVIADQLRSLGICDFYCLSEVSPENFETYLIAVGPGFASVNGQTGRKDRLQIIFNERRFELLETNEMMGYRDFVFNNGSHRSPLLARFLDRITNKQFVVMTNHLARGNAKLRVQQAIGLREWARDQQVAVINIGDFNFDYDFPSRNGNDAFREMLRDNIWLWVQPSEFIDTNWSGSREDKYPHSMLDFAFVSGPAKDWQPTCRVIVREGDLPDNEETSDNRRLSPEFSIRRNRAICRRPSSGHAGSVRIDISKTNDMRSSNGKGEVDNRSAAESPSPTRQSAKNKGASYPVKSNPIPDPPKVER